MEATRLDDENGVPDIDEYPDELYDMYRHASHSNTALSSPPARHQSNKPSRARSRSRTGDQATRQHFFSDDEEAAEAGDTFRTPSAHSSLEDFEILNDAGGNLSRPRGESRIRGVSRPRRAADCRTVRVKIHCGDDTRFLMVGTTVSFLEFADRIRDKLALRGKFKVRIKDEDDGDLITMGDGDDWEMAIAGVRKEARRDCADMGKMEVSFSSCACALRKPLLNAG